MDEDLADEGQCAELVSNLDEGDLLGATLASFAIPDQHPMILPANAAAVVELDQFNMPESRLNRRMVVNDAMLHILEDEGWHDWPTAVNGNGSRLIVIEGRPSDSAIVRVCDTSTGEQVKAFASDETTGAAAFTPDGNTFILNEGRGTILLYDAADISRQYTWDVRDRGERWRSTGLLAISPNGELAAFTVNEPESDQTTIRIWDIEENQETAVLSGHMDTVINLIFNDDGSLLVSYSMDDTVRIWGVPYE